MPNGAQEQHRAMAKAAALLRAGGVVAFPTETVYGLGADAFNPAAVAKVFALKGRPAHNPLIVHVDGDAMARRVAREWPEIARRAAEKFWPGPLTLVLPKHPDVPGIVTAGGVTVAVRCPDHPLALALLKAFGGPMVGPSANVSGGVSPTRAEHVRGAFDEREVLVLDGGACRAGIESTVVSLVDEPPRVLRPGVIGAEALSAALGIRVLDASPSPAQARVLMSPGLSAKHYAPRSRAVLVPAARIGDRLTQAGGACVVISHEPVRVAPPHAVIALPGDARGYASGLYAALREADASGPALIVIVEPRAVGDDAALWRAVLDRLRRATA